MDCHFPKAIPVDAKDLSMKSTLSGGGVVAAEPGSRVLSRYSFPGPLLECTLQKMLVFYPLVFSFIKAGGSTSIESHSILIN